MRVPKTRDLPLVDAPKAQAASYHREDRGVKRSLRYTDAQIQTKGPVVGAVGERWEQDPPLTSGFEM